MSLRSYPVMGLMLIVDDKAGISGLARAHATVPFCWGVGGRRRTRSRKANPDGFCASLIRHRAADCSACARGARINEADMGRPQRGRNGCAPHIVPAFSQGGGWVSTERSNFFSQTYPRSL